jgi:tetratricopeptide (TPR) repeat protein
VTPSSVPSLRPALAALGGAILLAGCGPRADAPLPPETDLYAYSLAVAERARAIVPSAGAKGLFHVGRVHERFGLEDRALEIYKEAMEEEPDLEGPHLRTGFILSQRKDRMADAAKAYQQVLLKNPKVTGVYTRLGLIFSHQGRLEDAVRMFEEEIRMGTAAEDTYYNLGQAFSLQGKHAEAVEAYQEASRRAPAMRSVYYSMAQSLRALGKPEEEKAALETFRKLKQEEDREAAATDAATAEREARLQHAAETWMDAAEIFSDAGSRGEDPAEKDRAVAEFRRAMEEAMRLSPSFAEPRQVMVDYWRSRNDIAKAAQACVDGLEAVRGDPALARAAYEVAGKCMESARGAASPAGWIDLAERLLAATVSSVPSFPDAHRELARILMFHRKARPDLLPRALAEARQAVELDPSPENYDILAAAYHKNGQPEVAFRTLAEGIKRHPQDPTLKDRMQRLTEREED